MSSKPPDTRKPAAAVPGQGDKYSRPADDNRAVGENIGGHLGTQKALTGDTAPEVSQGAWRERAFTPRATMGRAEMLTALRLALEPSKVEGRTPRVVFDALRLEWLPVLRQAMEQAGGDGLDAWLLTALKPPGRVPTAPLLTEMVAAFGAMRQATELAGLLAQAQGVIEAVERATASNPRRVSFKQMERELEGKVEIHELLLILFSTGPELEARLEEITRTMETLRGQLKSMPGAKPDGMYSNFARLKAEARVLTAELTRRSHAPK
jgi:hypothetical protein